MIYNMKKLILEKKLFIFLNLKNFVFIELFYFFKQIKYIK